MTTEESPQALPALTWQRVAGFAAALAILMIVLPWTQADRERAEHLTTSVLLRAQKKDLGAAIDKAVAAHTKKTGVKLAKPLALKLEYIGPKGTESVARDRLTEVKTLRLEDQAPHTLTLAVTAKGESLDWKATLALRGAKTPEKMGDGSKRVGRWTAILPPLLAVLVAFFFKRLIWALFGAVWLGAMLQVPWYRLDMGIWKALSEYLFKTASDSFNLYIIGFTIALVGMVHVMLRSGGLAGLLERLSRFSTGRRSSALTTALMGGAVFFDDYANTIVVGSTMRPLTDERRLSREKLAYIVDSTSAPVAGIAVISTWIGYEVGLFDELAKQLGLAMSGYEVFFAILPLRFYCLFALAFVFMNAATGRDFGPMLTAERRAWETGDTLRPGAKPLTQVDEGALDPTPGAPLRWYNAVVPVAVVLAATLVGMFWSGWSAGDVSIPGLWEVMTGEKGLGVFGSGWAQAAPSMGSWEAWRDALSNANGTKVLFAAAMLGSVVAVVMARVQGILSWRESGVAWARAVPGMKLAVAILVLAWAIRSVCDDLGTGIYLIGAVEHLISPTILPLLTFALAAVVAFATGTSWGTMGIMLPAMIPLAHALTVSLPNGELLLLLCFGAVLDGAIFGDHCSPISDTTVMSSISSGCDHIDHVKTQAPYALVVMMAAASVGYVGVAFGLPVSIALVAGPLALLVVLFGVGRRVDA